MRLSIFAAAIVMDIAAVSVALALDQHLPPYQVVPGISGQIKSVGSDTLKIEMTRWAKGFKDLYPGVNIEIESKGLGYGLRTARRKRNGADFTDHQCYPAGALEEAWTFGARKLIAFASSGPPARRASW